MAVQISLCIFAILTSVLCVAASGGKSDEFKTVTKTLAGLAIVMYGLFSLIQIMVFNVGMVFIIMGLVLFLTSNILSHPRLCSNHIFAKFNFANVNLAYLSYFIGVILFATFYGIDLFAPILTAVCIAVLLALLLTLAGNKLKLLNCFIKQSVFNLFIITLLFTLSFYLVFININFLIIAIGVLLLLISSLISFMQILQNRTIDKFLSIINSSLYYSGQILIATSLFLF